MDNTVLFSTTTKVRYVRDNNCRFQEVNFFKIYLKYRDRLDNSHTETVSWGDNATAEVNHFNLMDFSNLMTLLTFKRRESLYYKPVRQSSEESTE